MPQLSLSKSCCCYFFDKKASEKVPLFNVCMSHEMILLHPSFGSKEEKTTSKRHLGIPIYITTGNLASVRNNNNMFCFKHLGEGPWTKEERSDIFVRKREKKGNWKWKRKGQGKGCRGAPIQLPFSTRTAAVEL